MKECISMRNASRSGWTYAIANLKWVRNVLGTRKQEDDFLYKHDTKEKSPHLQRQCENTVTEIHRLPCGRTVLSKAIAEVWKREEKEAAGESAKARIYEGRKTLKKGMLAEV